MGMLVALELDHVLWNAGGARRAERSQRLVDHQQPPTGTKYTVDLRERAPQLAPVVVVEHLTAEHVVELPGGERQLAHRGEHALEVDALIEEVPGGVQTLQVGRGDVQGDDVQPEPGEPGRRPARVRADVEQTLARLEVDQLFQLDHRPALYPPVVQVHVRKLLDALAVPALLAHPRGEALQARSLLQDVPEWLVEQHRYAPLDGVSRAAGRTAQSTLPCLEGVTTHDVQGQRTLARAGRALQDGSQLAAHASSQPDRGANFSNDAPAACQLITGGRSAWWDPARAGNRRPRAAAAHTLEPRGRLQTSETVGQTAQAPNRSSKLR